VPEWPNYNKNSRFNASSFASTLDIRAKIWDYILTKVVYTTYQLYHLFLFFAATVKVGYKYERYLQE